MLLYLFWHWPDDDADPAAYEAALLGFHQSLRAGPPSGFRTSGTAMLPHLPWAEAPRAAYEDWYAVADGAALDALDDGAIEARRRSAHDAAARLSGGGHGGLYHLRSGALDGVTGPTAQWFAKPKGMSYGELFTALAPLLSAGTALLQRKMVLGPAPEFCLRAASEVELPAALTDTRVRMRPLAIA